MYKSYTSFKIFIKKGLQNTRYLCFLIISNLLSKTDAKEDKILIVPPANPGSKGDEAMVAGIIAKVLKLYGESHEIYVLSYSHVNTWDLDSYEFSGKFNNIILPNYLNTGYISFRSLLSLNSFTRTILIGADVLDGWYSPNRTKFRLRLSQLLSRLGSNTRWVSFSFNKTVPKGVKKELLNIDDNITWYPRDPSSLSRLVNIIGGEKVYQGADVSFLLEPSNYVKNNKSDVEEIFNEENKNKKIIGININITFANWHGKKFKKIEENLSSVINIICNKYDNIHFVFIPHDNRGEDNDYAMLDKLYQKINLVNRSKISLPKADFPANEIKYLCGNLDACVSARMHLSLACFSSHVPVIGLPYQDKFDGLFSLLKIDNLLCEEKKLIYTEYMVNLIDNVISNNNMYKEKLKYTVEEARNMSLKSIEL